MTLTATATATVGGPGYRGRMKRLVRWFLQGLIYFVPIALTVFVLVSSFQAIDRGLRGLLGVDVPGAGVLILVVLVTLLGFLLSNFLSRRVLGLFEGGRVVHLGRGRAWRAGLPQGCTGEVLIRNYEVGP